MSRRVPTLQCRWLREGWGGDLELRWGFGTVKAHVLRGMFFWFLVVHTKYQNWLSKKLSQIGVRAGTNLDDTKPLAEGRCRSGRRVGWGGEVLFRG